MTGALLAACRRAMHVVTPDGQILRAGRAVLFVLETVGYHPFWARRLARFPFIFAVEWGYALVAGHRPFFAKILFRNR